MTTNLMYHLKKLVLLLVCTGFSPAHAGSYEDFFRAIMRNDERVIQQLLAKGFDANTPDEYGRPGLLVAIEETSARAATVLVNWPKTDMNALNAKGESALMLASISGQVTMASQLIQRGADVNKTGWTPLHYAASKGHVAVISLLLENHAYIDAPSPNGTTPLMMAAMYGTGAAVKLLLDQGADPNLKNQQGLTAFNFAENGERPDAIKLLAPAAAVRGVIRSTGQW